MATFIDGLGQVTVPLNAGRMIIKQNTNGVETDSKILFSDLVANLVNSSILGVSVGQIPTLISGTGGSAFPALSGENLTNLDFSGINVGNSSTTGTTRLSDSTISTSGESGGVSATPLAIKTLKDDYTNLLLGKASIVNNNSWGFQSFDNGLEVVGEALSTNFTLSDTDLVSPDKSLTNTTTELKWGVETVWDGGNLRLTNSNSSNESSGVATTPAGVNGRVIYIGDARYLNLINGSVQTIEDGVIVGTGALPTQPALGIADFRGQVAFNAPLSIADLTGLNPAGTLKNLQGNLEWDDNVVLTENLLSTANTWTANQSIGEQSSVGTNRDLSVYGSIAGNSLSIGFPETPAGSITLASENGTGDGGYLLLLGNEAKIQLGDTNGTPRDIKTIPATYTTSGANSTISVAGAEVLTKWSLSNNNSVGTEDNLGATRVGIEGMITRRLQAEGLI